MGPGGHYLINMQWTASYTFGLAHAYVLYSGSQKKRSVLYLKNMHTGGHRQGKGTSTTLPPFLAKRARHAARLTRRVTKIASCGSFCMRCWRRCRDNIKAKMRVKRKAKFECRCVMTYAFERHSLPSVTTFSSSCCL